MKALAWVLISLSLFASVASQSHTGVALADTQPAVSVPRFPPDQDHAKWLATGKQRTCRALTGSVQIEELSPAHDPSRVSRGKVTFEPGARSAWHTHALGQILIVTEGKGWIQRWGGPVEEIRKGDVIWIPAGAKHWPALRRIRR